MSTRKGDGSRLSHHKGIVGEGRFICWAASKGWHIYKGFDGHAPVDFIADNGTELVRVEVKRVQSVQEDERGRRYVTTTRMNKCFDYVFLSTPTGDYWIPAADCGQQTISIRVDGPSSRDKYAAFKVTG